MTKPTNGYATRTEAARALKSQGKGPTEIGRILGISASAASGIIGSAERRTREKQKRVSANAASLSIAKMLPIDVRQDLISHARKRDLSLDRLIFDLLAEIAQRDLVDRILGGRGGRIL